MIGSKRKSISAIIAAAAFFGLTGVATLGQSQPTQTELLDQVRSLQTRIQQLETKQNATEAKVDSAMVDKAVAEVMADSEKRSQMLESGGFTAGYSSNKFVIQSEDGNFLLHPYVQFLFRHATTMRQDAKVPNGDDTQSGFEVRRLKLGFDGNFISKDFTYHFLWATDRKSGNLLLEEAYGTYKFADDFSVQAGQIKNFYSHEAMSSSKRLFAAERSLLNDVFTGGDNFVQGVALLYQHGPIHGAISYTDGANAPNQNFQDFPTNKANYGIAGRFEYKVMGDWKSYEDFTALGNKEDLLVLGAGFDYTEAGHTATISHTVDAQFESGAFGAYAAFMGRSIQVVNGADRYDYGVVAQLSYLIDQKYEPFVRYDYISFDDGSVATGLEQNVHEIAVGMNYYIRGHNAKFTADLTWLPNGSPVTNDGGDILSNTAGKNEYVLRVQFQLLL